MDIYRRIGERIRRARLKAELTQPELARLLDVSKGIISRWETGLARPSLDRLEPLANLLGTTIEQLLGFSAAEEKGVYRCFSVPVWEIKALEYPNLQPEAVVGQVLVSEEEAFSVDGAFLVSSDFFFPPYLVPGDIIGIQRRGRPKVGELLFAWTGSRIILRRYGGKRKGERLLPLDISQELEIVKRSDILGVYRWLRRPGSIMPRKEA